MERQKNQWIPSSRTVLTKKGQIFILRLKNQELLVALTKDLIKSLHKKKQKTIFGFLLLIEFFDRLSYLDPLLRHSIGILEMDFERIFEVPFFFEQVVLFSFYFAEQTFSLDIDP